MSNCECSYDDQNHDADECKGVVIGTFDRYGMKLSLCVNCTLPEDKEV
jgi:hypothetical protein